MTMRRRMVCLRRQVRGLPLDVALDFPSSMPIRTIGIAIVPD